MKKAVSLLLAAIMVFSFISLFGVVTSSTAEAASSLPKTNSEILSKYTEVVNQMKAVDKPTYRKVEYQQLNPQKQKFSSASNLAVSVAEGFLTTKEEAKANAKQTEQGDMGGIPIYLNKNSCILKDASAIKTATYKNNGDGTATIKITLKDELNAQPAKENAKKAPGAHGGMFSPIDRSVLMDDLSEIPVLTVEKLNLTYTGCTATVKFRLSDNHVLTFKQVMNIDVELKGKVIILPLNEKIRIVNNLEIDNFTYKPTVTGFKSTAQTKDSLSLSWNKAKGAAKYNVYTYNTSTNTYKKVASTSTNKVTLKKLTPGATYRLAVKPVINGKEIGSSSLLTTSTKPEAPTITVKSSAKKAATVSWSKVKGATSYLVYSSDTKTGSFKKLAEVKGTSYTNKKLTSGKTVYFKVVACKTLGKTNFLSAASAVKSVKVK